MNETNRDIRILEHIVNYCQQITEAMEHFGNDQVIFLNKKSIKMLFPFVFSRLVNSFLF